MINREEAIKKTIERIESTLDETIDSLLVSSKATINQSLDDTLNELSSLIGKVSSQDVNHSRLVTLTDDFKFLRDNSQSISNLSASFVNAKSEMANYSLNNTRSVISVFSKDSLIPIQSAEILEEIMKEPMSGLTIPEMMRRDREELILRTKRTMSLGIRNGETYGDISKKVAKIYDNNYNKAKSIVSTELHRASERAKFRTIEEINKQVGMVKTWNSLQDELVRVSHNSLNGKTIPADEDFVSDAGGKGPGPGQMGNAGDDIYCRCFLTFDFANPQEDAINQVEELPNVFNQATTSVEIVRKNLDERITNEDLTSFMDIDGVNQHEYLYRRFNRVLIDESNYDAMAYVQDKHTINLISHQYKELLETESIDYVKDSLKRTMAHEVAHIIENNIAEDFQRILVGYYKANDRDGLVDFLEKFPIKLFDTSNVKKNVFQVINFGPPRLSGENISELFYRNAKKVSTLSKKSDIGKIVTSYAQTNYREFFAEVFTETYNDIDALSRIIRNEERFKPIGKEMTRFLNDIEDAIKETKDKGIYYEGG